MDVKIKVSDYIAKFLKVQKTKHVFEVAGGMITHILDSLYTLGFTKIISMHHEQASAFAADAYGRYFGRPGVALATSGPGATNLLTGIANCYFDSSPALFITGQVNVHEQKKNKCIRQLGFQETDIVTIAKSITKKSFNINEPEQIPQALVEGYSLAMCGRPGPVLIDIPMNIQSSSIPSPDIKFIEKEREVFCDYSQNLKLLYKSIFQAKKPLILVGQGVSSSIAREEFSQFIKILNIPVVSSLLGVDIVPYRHLLHVGMIGSYGNRWANLALSKCDLLIVIGSRLDIRQTGADTEGFRKGKIIYHIDCDSNEINNRIQNCIPIIMDIKLFLKTSIADLHSKLFRNHDAWINEIKQIREQWPDTCELKNFSGINPNFFMHQLSKYSKKTFAYLVDVGNHQMWAAQSLEIKKNQLLYTSGGLGSMGFALPAAIGCCFASGKKPIVVITGDGGFQMNIQELQTIVRNKLPIKIVVLNNQSLGMIRQFQDSYFASRHQSTCWGYSAPNFENIALAYGILSRTITLESEITDSLKWLWSEHNLPSLLQVAVNPEMKAYPKIAYGRSIYEMEPFVETIKMEGA